jgi:hypothetical protein
VAANPDVIERVMKWSRIDFAPAHRQPQWWRIGLATVLAIGLSLAADAALVAIATHVYPATKGYSHFQFSDYAKLTIVGIIIGCAAWPVVTRISSAPRWVFFRCAILVTLVLWLPDLWMLMHLAIALITYNLLVHLAPVRPSGGRRGRGAHAVSEASAS